MPESHLDAGHLSEGALSEAVGSGEKTHAWLQRSEDVRRDANQEAVAMA